MPEPNPFLPGATRPDSDTPHSCLQWTAITRSGTKKHVNDDSWLAFASDIKGAQLLEYKGTHSLNDHDLIFAVSDGMGGGNAGDVASRLLLETLSAMIPRTFKTAAEGLHPDYLHHLQQATQAVHLAINGYASENQQQQGMAATLALAWFTPENLYLCNAGDSRIYLHRQNQNTTPTTTQLTLDHTFAWQKHRRGEITERQFRNHPRRSALYQVIGGGHRDVKPHVAAFPYLPGDEFLICSDGLIDGLWEKHIHSAFIENTGSTSDLASSLMSRAAENDGSDDITLITLAVHNSEKSLR